jgi:hypothetical protein
MSATATIRIDTRNQNLTLTGHEHVSTHVDALMKMKSIMAARTPQPGAKGPRPEVDLGGGFAGAYFVSRVI